MIAAARLNSLGPEALGLRAFGYRSSSVAEEGLSAAGGGDSDGEWGDGGGGGGWDDADLDGDGQDLIDAPRRVEKLSISYARASKQARPGPSISSAL